MAFADWASSWHVIWHRCIVFMCCSAAMSLPVTLAVSDKSSQMFVDAGTGAKELVRTCVLVYRSRLQHCLSFSLKLAAFPTINRSIGVVKPVSLWLRKLKETLLVKGWQYIRDVSSIHTGSCCILINFRLPSSGFVWFTLQKHLQVFRKIWPCLNILHSHASLYEFAFQGSSIWFFSL